MASQFEPHGPEQRVYTDERMPGLEIHNDGGFTFVVISNEGAVVDEFTARERIGEDATSEPFAQRRAQEYFNRMAEQEAEVVGGGGEEEGAMGAHDDMTEPEMEQGWSRLNWQSKQAAPPPPHPKGKLGPMRDVGDMMTPGNVDAIIARARAERDPAKADALKRQAMSMMAQEESVAQRLVRMLLEF